MFFLTRGDTHTLSLQVCISALLLSHLNKLLLRVLSYLRLCCVSYNKLCNPKLMLFSQIGGQRVRVQYIPTNDAHTMS